MYIFMWDLVVALENIV